MRELALVLAWIGGTYLARAMTTDFDWQKLPALPPVPGQTRQPGVASPFVGVHHDALIVAGGANFPDKLPWDGGAKVWWDRIYVLENLTGPRPTWVRAENLRLPRPIAYGVSVSTSEGVVCAGGADAERCYADVFLLAWDAAARTVRRTELPAMPQPLAFMAGALVGDTLYVAGGQHTMKGATPSTAFWALDLAKRGTAECRWETLPSWPGAARILPVAAGRRTGAREAFYLFSGRRPRAGAATELLTDAYVFDSKTKSWRTLPAVGGGPGVCAMAGTAAAAGKDEILLFGGDRGDLFLELEAHDLAVEKLRRQVAGAAPQDRARLNAEIDAHLLAKRKIYDVHPGFSREVWSLNTHIGKWRLVTHAPVPLPVTTIAVTTGDTVLIPSGEIRPGIRTPDIVRVTPQFGSP